MLGMNRGCASSVQTYSDLRKSSMSAWIGTKQYLEYFNHPNSNLQGGVCTLARHPS
jgi:hypothetical protein